MTLQLTSVPFCAPIIFQATFFHFLWYEYGQLHVCDKCLGPRALTMPILCFHLSVPCKPGQYLGRQGAQAYGLCPLDNLCSLPSPGAYVLMGGSLGRPNFSWWFQALRGIEKDAPSGPSRQQGRLGGKAGNEQQTNAMWKQTYICRGNWVMIKMASQNADGMLHYLVSGFQINSLSTWGDKSSIPSSHHTQEHITDGLRMYCKKNKRRQEDYK